MFSNQPEVSTTSGSKVMAHYVILTKVVTLTLIFIRFLPKKKCQGPWNWVHELSNFQKDRTSRVACTSCNYGQTNRQTDKQTDRQTAVTNILCKNLRFCKVTNRGDQYTLRKSEISQSNESRSESGYFAKPLSFNCVINIYCDKSRSNVKGQRSKAKGQGHSQFSPSASNEKCTMGRVLLMIQYYYNSRKYVTLNFDMWPWLVSLTLTLMFDLEVDLV